MPQNWKTYKLQDLCTKIGSGSTPRGGKEAYYESGISLIRSQNVLDFKFSENGLAFINEKQAKQLSNVEIESGDVLLNITGDSVARCCQVPDERLPARVNQHVAIIRPDKRKLNSSLLKYLLLSPKYKKQLLSLASAGATRNAITKSMIDDFEVYIPENENEQTAIASILSALDDKIELNLQQNKTLEEMAMALYKHWFVDFGPFQDGEFIDSELGRIPKGWEVRRLKDLMNIKYGKDHKKLASGNNPCYGSGGIMRFVNDFLYDQESILIPRKGTLSNLFFIRKPFWSVDTMFYSKFYLPVYGKYLFYYLKKLDLASMDVGTAIPSLTTELLNKIEVLVPTLDILEKFDFQVTAYLNLVDENNDENQTLTELRDTLLPKLISGEVRMKDVAY